LKRRRKQRNGRQHIRVAMHTSTHLSDLSVPEMEGLVYGSLLDAFLPKILHISATPEQADERYEEHMRDPYWQSKYSALANAKIHQQYGGLLPIICQYQLDFSAVVSCLKVEKTVSFEPIHHFESNRDTEDDGGIMSNLDPSEMFFGMVTEEHTPEIKTWDGIRWDEIGVVPKQNFQHFVQILLRRLESIVFDIWKSGDRYAAANGFDQELVKGTYFDVIRDRFKHQRQTDPKSGKTPILEATDEQ